MKATVLRAHAIYSLKMNSLINIPVFDLVDALQAHYHFREIPSNQALLNPTQGPFNFIWGKARLRGPEEQAITIETLQVQNFPLLATTIGVINRSSTDDADLVLSDLAAWVSEEFGLDTEAIYPTSYQSHLEVTLNGALGDQINLFNPLAELITERVRDYGFWECPRYQPTGITLFFDSNQRTNPPTFSTQFTLERRSGALFSQNKYFSQAPLKTEDHKDILRKLEASWQ